LQNLDIASITDFRILYLAGLRDTMDREDLAREPVWTESLAVGDRVFVEQAAQNRLDRTRFEYAPVSEDGQVWSVRERGDAYTPVSAPELGAKALKRGWNVV
jgi:hypothetical protein